MSFAQSRWRNVQAPGPDTSIFEKLVSSNRPAVRRVARASAPIAGDQCSPAQPRGRRSSSAAGSVTPVPSTFVSNQFGRSQPDFSPNAAPRARRRE